MPAGYATTYDVVDSSNDFTFVTIELAGHTDLDVCTYAAAFLERCGAGPW